MGSGSVSLGSGGGDGVEESLSGCEVWLLGEGRGGYAGDVGQFDGTSSSNMRQMTLAERKQRKSKSSWEYSRL